MTDSQGTTSGAPLCDECLHQLQQLLHDWHAFVSVLEPIVTEDDRVNGHLVAVVEAVRNCQAGHHVGGRPD